MGRKMASLKANPFCPSFFLGLVSSLYCRSIISFSLYDSGMRSLSAYSSLPLRDHVSTVRLLGMLPALKRRHESAR